MPNINARGRAESNDSAAPDNHPEFTARTGHFYAKVNMNQVSTYLSADHKHCDDMFSEAENAVADNDWAQAETLFAAFVAATRRHFAREEDILFPAFEARTGMSSGPTEVMRAEHADMNELLHKLENSLQSRDRERFLGQSETLLMLMQQHNIKEEQILYPMADRVLGADSEALIGQMAA